MENMKFIGQQSDEQIANWKKQHLEVFAVTSEDKIGYLRKPRRAEMGLAMSHAAANPLKMTETIVQSCWLGGCTDLRDDDKYFYGLNIQIQQIIEMAEVEVKKL